MNSDPFVEVLLTNTFVPAWRVSIEVRRRSWPDRRAGHFYSLVNRLPFLYGDEMPRSVKLDWLDDHADIVVGLTPEEVREAVAIVRERGGWFCGEEA